MSAQHPFLNSINSVNDSYMDRLFDEAVKALGAATGAVNGMSAALTPLPDFSGLNVSLINPSEIVPAALPTMPTKPLLLDVPIGQMPAAPFLWTTVIADTSMLITLIARLIAECEALLANPYGVMGAMFDSIYAKGVDRETKAQRTGYQNYLASNAAMGFEAASGQDQSALMRFELEKKGKLSDINRDIMIKQIDVEKEIKQKALDQLLSLNARLLDLKQASESNELSLYDSQKKTVIDTAMLYIDINKGFIDIYASEIQAYSALASVTNEQARFRMDQYKQVNEMNLSLTNISLEKIKLIEAHSSNNAQLAMEKIKSIAAVNGQVGANWMNGINLSQSFSTGKSWSYGESLSA
jgi:hypothetical protein